MKHFIKFYKFFFLFATFVFILISCKKSTTTPDNTSTEINRTGALPNSNNSAFNPAPSFASGGQRPMKYDLTSKMPPVDPLGQGLQGSCVAWAIAYTSFSYFDHKQNNTNFYTGSVINRNSVFSPAYVYNQINGGQDNGSNFQDAFNILKTQGVATWTSMPYNVSNYTQQPNSTQISNASSHKIADAQIFSPINNFNIDKMKDLIYAGNPLPIRVVSDDNLQNGTDTIWSSVGTHQTGGHAMVVVGYDDNLGAFKVQNSWGNIWKARGFVWITYTNIKNVASEAYIIQPITTNGIPVPICTPGTNVTSSGFFTNWTGINPIATGYYSVELARDINFTLPVANSPQYVTHTNFTWVGLTPSTTYYCRIRVFNGTIWGDYSNTLTITTN
jgi:C1A family cysteine protease